MKNRFALVGGLLGALFLFSGCASLPSPDKMRSETAEFQLPKLPEAGKAIVYIVRPSSLGGFIRSTSFSGFDANFVAITHGRLRVFPALE